MLLAFPHKESNAFKPLQNGLYDVHYTEETATPIPSLAGIADDGDIYIEFDPITGLNIFVRGQDLVRDKGLRTAVLLSLFTDRVAEETDVLPDNSGDRRGVWFDPLFGSRLWLLGRSKLTPDIPARVEFYVKEALQWMITDGVASEILCSAVISSLNTVTWDVAIIKPGNTDNENFKFFFNWENEIFEEIKI